MAIITVVKCFIVPADQCYNTFVFVFVSEVQVKKPRALSALSYICKARGLTLEWNIGRPLLDSKILD
jgi:hypothetical protein